MNTLRAPRSLRRIAQHASRRTYANERPAIPPHPTPPTSPPNPDPNTISKPPSRVGAYYKSFSYPVLKSFLLALFTYQITYYAWLKLETVEDKHAKTLEIADLQEQLRVALERQRAKAGDVVDEVVDKVGEFAEETKEAGRAVVESVREGGEDLGKGAEAVGRVAGGGWWPW